MRSDIMLQVTLVLESFSVKNGKKTAEPDCFVYTKRVGLNYILPRGTRVQISGLSCAVEDVMFDADTRRTIVTAQINKSVNITELITVSDKIKQQGWTEEV